MVGVNICYCTVRVVYFIIPSFSYIIGFWCSFCLQVPLVLLSSLGYLPLFGSLSIHSKDVYKVYHTYFFYLLIPLYFYLSLLPLRLPTPVSIQMLLQPLLIPTCLPTRFLFRRLFHVRRLCRLIVLLFCHVNNFFLASNLYVVRVF